MLSAPELPLMSYVIQYVNECAGALQAQVNLSHDRLASMLLVGAILFCK